MLYKQEGILYLRLLVVAIRSKSVIINNEERSEPLLTDHKTRFFAISLFHLRDMLVEYLCVLDCCIILSFDFIVDIGYF